MLSRKITGKETKDWRAGEIIILNQVIREDHMRKVACECRSTAHALFLGIYLMG